MNESLNNLTKDWRIVADDMILTQSLPTTAGSKMLEGYESPLESEALTRLLASGYTLVGKTDVGEFAIDLVGETSFKGVHTFNGTIKNATAETIVSGNASAALCLEVNGSVRRASAQSGLVSIKPTYGTVSRYGVIPVVSSGDTVSILASRTDVCREILSSIAGHDEKDGTSLPDGICATLKSDTQHTSLHRIALLSTLTHGIDATVHEWLDDAVKKLRESGVTVDVIENGVIAAARPAWNVLLCAELCKNVARYDGVRYGYRAKDFSGIDELYTNSRTEAFGELLKTAILFGSETLSNENYTKVYDKSLRVRRVITEEFAKIFEEYDAILLPACSTSSYTEEQITADTYLAFKENLYTAPASIAGLPAVVAGGVQLIGSPLSELTLLDAAEIIERRD